MAGTIGRTSLTPEVAPEVARGANISIGSTSEVGGEAGTIGSTIGLEGVFNTARGLMSFDFLVLLLLSEVGREAGTIVGSTIGLEGVSNTTRGLMSFDFLVLRSFDLLLLTILAPDDVFVIGVDDSFNIMKRVRIVVTCYIYNK